VKNWFTSPSHNGINQSVLRAGHSGQKLFLSAVRLGHLFQGPRISVGYSSLIECRNQLSSRDRTVTRTELDLDSDLHLELELDQRLNSGLCKSLIIQFRKNL